MVYVYILVIEPQKSSSGTIQVGNLKSKAVLYGHVVFHGSIVAVVAR